MPKIKIGPQELELFLDPSTNPHADRYLNGSYVKEELVYEKLIKPGDVVLDCGANIGYFSILFNSLGAEVHSFEPVSSVFETLRSNTDRFQGIHINQQGVYFKCCQKDIFLSEQHNQGSTLYNSVVSRFKNIFKNKLTEQVELVTLNSYCKNNSIENIKLIKMDIEGAEDSALKGANNILSKTKFIVFEAQNNKFLNQIKSTLQSFSIKKLDVDGAPMYLASRKIKL